MRTGSATARTTGRRTWLFCAAWLSIWPRWSPPKRRSRVSSSAPDGITPTWSPSSPKPQKAKCDSPGYGPYLRDVLVSGNVVRQSGVGVAVSVAPNAGAAQIANNLFSRCPGGGVVGYEWDKAASADLTFGGAGRFAHLAITGNTVR